MNLSFDFSPRRTLARRSALLGVLIVIGLAACGPQTIPAQPTAATGITSAELRAQAETLLAAGRPDAGLAYLNAAAEDAADPALWLDVFHRHVARGEWQSALHALTALRALEPNLPEANYWVGVILAPYEARRAYVALLAVGADPDYGEAAQTLRTTIETHQLESPVSQAMALGEALVTLGHWAQAGQAFDIAAALKPDLAVAWASLALCEAQQGWPGDELITHALNLAPDDPSVLYLAGVVARLHGHPEQAVARLTTAQQVDPVNPALAAELGNAYRATGDLVTAESWLRRAADLAPSQGEFLKLLAFFYAEESYDLAGNGLTALREATVFFPEDPDLLAAYGWALFNSGATAEGVAALRDSLSLAPNNPRALYYRGLIYQAQGNRDLAVLTLSRLLRLPDSGGFDVLARRILEQLAF